MTQRAAKTHRAALAQDGRISTFELVEFCEIAARELTAADNEDAAYYFEQVAEHLRTSPNGLKDKPARILGL